MLFIDSSKFFDIWVSTLFLTTSLRFELWVATLFPVWGTSIQKD